MPHDRQQNAYAYAPHKPQRGFTLLELLIVVAIIVVLSAVAIPLVGKNREQLKTTELDAIARQIFVAAQNKSTAMMALGSFAEFDASEGNSDVSLPAGVSPSTDYHYAAHAPLSAYLAILPAGSIDSTVLNNRYFIEYNYKTGDIYGVFYTADDSLTYAEAAAIRDASPRKTASGVMVGYFGGAEGSGLETMRTKAPSFKLVNGEELYVVFENMEDDVTYTLTVTDATSPSAEPIRFCIGKGTIGNSMRSEPTLSDATVTLPIKRDVAGSISIILDSLDPTLIYNPDERDRRFCTNFTDTKGEKRIVPGHDLYVSGKAQKGLDDKKKIVYLESDEVSYFTNSLFDSVSREKDKNEVCAARCFRHLQNLDAASGYTPESALFEGKLTAALDWTTMKADLKSTDEATRKATAGCVAPDSLAAISHASLLVFDGQGNEINHTPLGVNQNGATGDGTAGLFGIFTGREGSELRRVRLVNPILTPDAETTAQYAGLLAGKIEGEKAALADCQVYADPKNAQAFSECRAALPKSVLYFGGLVGSMQGGSVTDCFAAMPAVTLSDDAPAAARYMGGLIGQAKGVSLLRCYANTDMTLTMGGAQDKLGGCIGLMDGGKCETCYASGVLSVDAAQADCRISGFANVQNNARFPSCYTAATYGEGLFAPEYLNPADEPTPALNQGAKVYGFCDAPMGASADDRYYLRTAGVTEFTNADGTQTYGTGLDYDDMAKNASWIVPSQWKTDKKAADTHPYTMSGVYPFPIPAGHGAQNDKTRYPIPHYGDWPVRQGVKYLAYYEKYEGGAFGFFLQNDAEADTLQNEDTAVVIDDGYAVLCEATDPAPVLLYTTAKGLHSAALTDSGTSVSVKPKNGPSVSCKAYIFPAAALEDSVALKQTSVTVKDSYYHAFSASGYRFFANPNFAKYVVNGQDSLPGADYEPTPIALRTSRHLHRLSLPGQDAYWDRAFYQERAIDFKTYPARVAAQLSPQPIGNSAVSFTGIFDGGRHVINGLPVSFEQGSPDMSYAGMFGLCTGTARLTRIRLQNPSINAAYEGNTASCAGILAGALRNQTAHEGSKDYMISDCYVFAKDIHNANSPDTTKGVCALNAYAGAAGGLVGSVTSCSICDCLVSATLIDVRSSSAGGFAGEITGAASNVERCYANTKLLKAVKTGAVGGFAGTSTAIVRGAYALGKLSADGSDAAGFILQNNGECYDCYTLCTYNQDESTGLRATNGYGFSKTATATKLSHCYYWGTTGTKESAYGTILTYEEMAKLRGDASKLDTWRFADSPGATFGYERTDNYPFTFLLSSNNNIMPHYGDWPAASGIFLAYYEKYADNTYGYYTGVDLKGIDLTNPLDNPVDRAKQKRIVEDGYAILSDIVPSNVTYGRQLKNDKNEPYYTKLDLQTQTTHDKLTSGGVTYNVYRFDQSTAEDSIMGMGGYVGLAERMKIDENNESTAASNLRFSYYYRVSIDDVVYYFNPCFAKTVVRTLTMEPTKNVSIRTERQLRCLADGRTDYRYWGWLAQDIEHPDTLSVNPNTIWFVQDHDIEPMGSAASTSNLIPIGNDQRAFCGGYDGDHYLIKNFSVSGSGQYIALFGYNIGQLCNIVFITDIGNIISGSDCIGAIVGVNDVKNVTYLDDNKTVTLRGGVANCIAAGFNISTNGIGGGFAYANYGDIADCAAVLYTSRRTGGALACVGGSGGFVCVNGSTGKISNCFAVITNTATNNLSSQCGFVRDMSGDISNCYCAGVNSESKYMGFNSQYVPTAQLTGGRLAYDGTNHASIRDAFADYKVEDAAHTHPIDPDLTGACPWPSFQHDRDKKYQFYGNWMIP